MPSERSQPNCKVWFHISENKAKMASSPLTSKSHFHARSVSLPSRPHPLVPQVNDHLRRVRSSSAATFSSSICSRLSGLEDLYERVGDLLLLPRAQVPAQEDHEKWIDEVLDGYLRLLDVSGAIKDVLSQTKQHVQELLSVLRRRRDTKHFGEYLAFRKRVKKVIQKSLKDLKSVKNKRTPLDSDENIATVSTLSNEVETATAALFESLLFYIAGRKVQSKAGRWSLVSKLMNQKGVAACQNEEEDANEFEKVDAALSLMDRKTSKVESVQSQLVKLESSIKELEEGIESLFRRLIKTRVSLLNILNH